MYRERLLFSAMERGQMQYLGLQISVASILVVIWLSSILEFCHAAITLPNTAGPSFESLSDSNHYSLYLQSVPHSRDYFYVGGEYVTVAPGKSVMANQMYVEKLSPPVGAHYQSQVMPPYPVVFIHGAGWTGTNWLNTPDGRPGWASYFLALGYTVYIVDQPTRGRSAWLPGDPTNSMTVISAESMSECLTDTQHHDIWPQASLHTQWPGSGVKGDPFFDAFFSSTVQFSSNNTEAQIKTRNAGVSLLDRIGPAILITHSQGGLHGWTIADARPSLVKAIIAVEPRGPPFHDAFDTSPVRTWGVTDIALAYEPSVSDPNQIKLVTIPSNRTDRVSCVLQQEPGARQLPNLRAIPVLLEVSQASYHALYDHCTLAFFQQAGLQRVELLRLEDIGIEGNGHLQMMEKNNLKIAQALHQWAGKVLGYSWRYCDERPKAQLEFEY